MGKLIQAWDVEQIKRCCSTVCQAESSHIAACMYACVCVPPAFDFCERACVMAGSDGHTLTRLTHLAPMPLMGAPYWSRLVRPLKQASVPQQRLGPKPSFHSTHRPRCLFSEALEETLDGAYQIQTVARLCYFTHRPPLNSASFSVIVFFLAW